MRFLLLPQGQTVRTTSSHCTIRDYRQSPTARGMVVILAPHSHLPACPAQSLRRRQPAWSRLPLYPPSRHLPGGGAPFLAPCLTPNIQWPEITPIRPGHRDCPSPATLRSRKVTTPTAPCGFRWKRTTDSGAKRPVVPVERDHRFRVNPTTRASGRAGVRGGWCLQEERSTKLPAR